MSGSNATGLPIEALLPDLLQALERERCVLLQAPPGAGKTTRVPPALLDAPWRGEGRILMLEPRRLAARAAARFMAAARGEPVGKGVGFRTRLESRVSPETVIEVVTEGILLRRLQRDPELSGIAAVLFDEFHERSLNADVGLVLAREVQQALRPDLRLVVMSATLETEPLARMLDDAPVLTSEGRSHPVEVTYRPPRQGQRLEDATAAAIREALEREHGSVLVFLPGIAEIRRVAERLEGTLGSDTDLCPLHGTLDPARQDAAIAAAPAARRKVVLATAIAETSLTIEGVRVVIDAGLERRARFDAGSGMTRLVTERVSRASAEQRKGRAGRIEPGLCIRLWSEGEQRRLRPFAPPEIAEADLSSTVLQLAQWGTVDPSGLDWLDPPPAAHWDQAVDLLRRFGALDEERRITDHGRALLEPGLEPRMAQLLVCGRARGAGATAAALAGLLADRDPLPHDTGSDLEDRLAALDGRGRRDAHRGRIRRARALAARLRRDGDSPAIDASRAGELLALAWPDRVARRRSGGQARFVLANGRGAWLPDDDPLAASDWLVAAELDGREREARIFLAARTDRATIEEVLGPGIEESVESEWDDERGTVVVRRRRRLDRLVLEEHDAGPPDPEQLAAGLLDAVRRLGLETLDWTASARQYRARVETMRALEPEAWPPFDDEALREELAEWLGPFLAGHRRLDEVRRMDLLPALEARLGHERARRLRDAAPTHVEVPAGARVALDYAADSGPVLAVKLQALFGWSDTPRIAGGRLPVVLHLLDPAGRPLAVTTDLASFWANAYIEVAKDMRGRYPKHPWPEDPATATATMKTKKGMR